MWVFPFPPVYVGILMTWGMCFILAMWLILWENFMRKFSHHLIIPFIYSFNHCLTIFLLILNILVCVTQTFPGNGKIVIFSKQLPKYILFGYVYYVLIIKLFFKMSCNFSCPLVNLHKHTFWHLYAINRINPWNH